MLLTRLSYAAGLAAALAFPRALAAQTSPVGFWNTISDDDGKPTAVVEIRESGGELTGVVRALLVAAEPADSVCGKCSGDRRGKRIVGMEILRRMRRQGDVWSGGEILDPENGKTYRATIRLADGGRKLIVRGYIGLSVFGRSQTWVRREDRRAPNDRNYDFLMRPDSTSHPSVLAIVSRAPRNPAPSSRTAFALSVNQYRVAYGTT
jgi:uncharacterized protein (DUF2147 family)